MADHCQITYGDWAFASAGLHLLGSMKEVSAIHWLAYQLKSIIQIGQS